MSRKAEDLAAEYVSALLNSSGVQKAVGSANPALLMVAVTPLMEQLVTRDRHIRKTSKAIKRQQKMLRAIATPQTPTVSPMRLPARPRQVDFRPQDWRTVLEPTASEPIRNGAHHAAEAAEYTPDIPPGHEG